MSRVVWSDLALNQLEAIKAYIELFNPRVAIDVAAEIIAAGNNLTTFPHRGRQVPKTELRELVTSYPYIIRYRITHDGVRILRVRHTARRPTTP